MSSHALFVKQSPPAEDSLVHILGKQRHGEYKLALARLAELSLKPGWAWAGQTDGWTVRFKRGESTVCRILLTREPLVGQVGVGRQQMDAMRATTSLPASIAKLLETTPEHGSQRTVDVPLNSNTGLSKFITLVGAKLSTLTP